jgi:XTP/dITP diphosphohydrolase
MKKIILASANQGKIKEIKALLPEYEVLAYSELLGKFDIIEDGDSFKANAMIKAQAIYDRLENPDEYIILSDDSGISIEALGGEPGIYSARYAGENPSDKDNLNKVIENLKAKNVSHSKAFYTAAMSIYANGHLQSVHGWMHGDVTTTARGDGGFGYDPIFVPEGYNETLAQLPNEVKERLSHRSKALHLIKQIIKSV